MLQPLWVFPRQVNSYTFHSRCQPVDQDIGEKLEQPLFIRSTKKVQLTPAGKVLLKHIEPAMNLIQRGESQLSILAALDLDSSTSVPAIRSAVTF